MTTKLRAASFQDGAVTNVKIAADAITNAKIADDAVKTENVASTVNLGRRNIVINGAMQVAQRGTSSTGLGATDGYYTLDRFNMVHGDTSAGRYTMTQSDVTDLEGFSNALKIDCTTADTSVAAGEILLLSHFIEGFNVQPLKKTSTTTRAFTISFYAKSNASRAIGLEARLSNGTNRQASSLHTIGTSWARYTMTIPAASNTQIDNDNSVECAINFWLHAGSTYTSGTMSSSLEPLTQANRAAGIGSIFASTDNTLEITGVQLEVGEQATPFEHRSFGEELALCKRYFQVVRKGIMGECMNANGTCNWWYEFPVEMRAIPSIICTKTAYRYGDMVAIGVEMTSISVSGGGYRSEKTAIWNVSGTKSSTPTQYRIQLLEPQNTNHGDFQFAAEL